MEKQLNSFEFDRIEDTEPANSNDNHGWQKVTYAKKQRKHPTKKPDSGKLFPNGSAVSGGETVFSSLEKRSEERRRRIEAQRAANADEEARPVRSSKHRSNDDDSDDEFAGGVVQNGAPVVEKKPKPKKQKKPKVTIAEAATKIDADDLSAFLADITASYESQQDIQLMRFADYFGRSFSAVSASQFPWTKLFRESTIGKIADIPVCHIAEAVYKVSVDWINQRSNEALASFVLWCLDSILADLACHPAGGKGSKKGARQTSSKSQVAIFSVLAMVLRRKPEVLISLLPVFNESSKYKGQDKLPLIVWMIAQACQGDLAVGLYSWSHLILPLIGVKSGSNPQTRDLVLQSIERILSAPKARTILVNGAVRKGERLMPPSALDLLLRVTFPAKPARVKATERFEAIYPTLKEVALAGVPGSKGIKQVTQQMLIYCSKAVKEGIPELSREAKNIFIWCLTQHPDSYKQWDNIYLEYIDSSIAILEKLQDQWRQLSLDQSSLQGLEEALKSFSQKNEKELTSEVEADRVLFERAETSCKWLLGRLSRGNGCLKGLAFVVIALGVGAAIISPRMESIDWKDLSAFFSQQSF